MNVSARGHCDRYGTKQDTDKAREAQEAARALDGVTYLRACVGDIVNTLAFFLVRYQPHLEFVNPRTLSREQRTIADTAARLNQLCSSKIRIVHQQAGSQLCKCSTTLVRP